ncbi:N-acetyl-gamma-glutamyl-phosphate reductase [Baekduia soli]|uniref:N-acetyl-gamma-glutamyl-phosphate reductase n=1 Tax=Baekduia soli TaxID=496014 RepID=A0A5B8U6R7_9ACTN|nr:N-acetyl-gamma-glutamyl-phosphate reductase [Baekduia soli]QEC48829.1 N-acetyl-gamma-glutamyl-phosphate reductase [Baekduia soli]
MADAGPRVLVAGASGFAGALAARLVERHPRFVLGPVTSRSDAGTSLDVLYPHHRVGRELEVLDLDRHGDVDAAIVAYPHGASAPVVAELLGRGVKVVDLSADFRLRDLAVYEEYYVPHPHPELLGDAVYGLPELYRDALRGTSLVAGPGCYPTAAILTLAPLARAGLLDDVVIDAKSGVSGAGRAATAKTHFVSVDENVSPYGVGTHRHAPEIDQELGALGAPVTVTFTPHLVPLDQGELVSCYVRVAGDAEPGDIVALYEQAYAGEPFVELSSRPPGVRDVRETNVCRIHVTIDPRSRKVLAFGAIDNLWKGTSSQAVQSLNLMFGFGETEGLA